MSNLKKILALVLALVMSFSLVSVSSAAFKDQDQIDAKYAEAVEVLNALKIFKGDDLGNFNPKAPITRQEVAAMMYRVISTDVTDANDGLYVDACKFEDVTANWAKGYIGYCANGGYIKGVGDNKFDPQGNISGVAVLAMILRAVGYDKNGEFTGSEWDYNVLTVATSLGILSGIDESVESLKKPASRELVAELIFRAMIKAEKVTYTPAFGYQPIVNTINAKGSTVGYDNFKLCSNVVDDTDMWGNPVYCWVQDANKSGRVGTADDLTPYTILATFAYAPKASFTTAVKECEIADALGGYAYDTVRSAKVTINGQAATTMSFNPVNTAVMHGGQGRLTNVFNFISKETGSRVRAVTMMDTFLALVEKVYPATYDNAGHIKTYPQLVLRVYDQKSGATTTYNKYDWNAIDWTYKAGDMVLINAYTKGDATTTATGTVAPFVAATEYVTNYVEVVSLADFFEGVQSVIWMNAGKHTVNGVDYMDANTFNLDQAQKETTNHVWYKDTYGNIIGAVDAQINYNYGVMTNLWWVNDGANGGAGSAMATFKYIDGSESGAIKVATVNGLYTAYAALADNVGIQGLGGTNARFFVSTYNVNNAALLNNELYRIETLANGSVALTETRELTKADVNTKVAAITGDVTSTDLYKYNSLGQAVVDETLTSKTPVYADNFTQFLVYNYATKTYTTYLGIDNVPYHTKNDAISVEYVDYDNDSWVDCVFIYGTPDTSDSTKFVYMTNKAYTETLATAGGVKYYTMLGVSATTGENVELVMTDSTLKDTLVAGTGALFLVTSNSGVVKAVQEVTSLSVEQPYTYNVADFYEGDATVEDMTAAGNGFLVVDNEGNEIRFNINVASTVVVTEDGKGSVYSLTDLALEGKNVYVIYDSRNLVASAVFVTENDWVAAEPEDDSAEELLKKLEEAIKALQDALNDATKYTATVTEGAEIYQAIVDALDTIDEIMTALDALELTEEQTEAYAEVAALVETVAEDVEDVKADVVETAVEKALAVLEDDDATEAEKLAAAQAALALIETAEAEDTYADEITDLVAVAGPVELEKALETLEADLVADVTAAIEKANKNDLIYVTGLDAAIAEAVAEAVEAKLNPEDADEDYVAFADIATFKTWYNAQVTALSTNVWNELSTEQKVSYKKEWNQWIEGFQAHNSKLTDAEKTVLANAKKAAQDAIIAATAETINDVTNKVEKDLYKTMLNIDANRIGSKITVKVGTANAVVTASDVGEIVWDKIVGYGTQSLSLNTDKTVATITMRFGEWSEKDGEEVFNTWASITIEVAVEKVVG